MAQRLDGPDSTEVDELTSKFVMACRGHRKLEALTCAERILAIYDHRGIDIPALATYRRFIESETEWSNAT